MSIKWESEESGPLVYVLRPPYSGERGLVVKSGINLRHLRKPGKACSYYKVLLLDPKWENKMIAVPELEVVSESGRDYPVGYVDHLTSSRLYKGLRRRVLRDPELAREVIGGHGDEGFEYLVEPGGNHFIEFLRLSKVGW